MVSESLLRRIEGRVEDFIRRHGLAHRPEPLIVAVSGGPDSLCLLHAVNRLREPLGINLHLAHLNHCLRGPESDGDAEFVAGQAKRLGLGCTIHREDVKGRQGAHSSSLEEKAREARYEFLSKVAGETGAAAIATGHTAQDQAETVLLHILRGSGLSGLRGMREVLSQKSTTGTEFTLVRPLLAVSRQETEGYCKALGLEPRVDRSNLSMDMVRNRVRLELIPYLREYNPNILEALLRLSSSAHQDMEFIGDKVVESWDAVVTRSGAGFRLKTEIVSALPASLQHHLIRKVLEAVLGDLVDIEYSHVQSLVELMSKPVGKRIDLPRGVTAIMEYGQCLITCGQPGMKGLYSIVGEQELPVPGAALVGGWEIESWLVDGHDIPAGNGVYEATLDADAVGEKLTVRARRPGDGFRPLGLKGAKKLQDYFVDAKVPEAKRDQVPLVCSKAGIVWVVGHRIDEGAKVTDSTRRVVRLRARRV